MNKTILVLVLSLMGFVAMAQEKNVPAEIKNFITQKYPAAVIGKVKKSSKEFNVKYEVAKTKYTSKFGSDFAWIQTEYKISGEAIPAKVKNTIKKKHPNGNYSQMKVVETPLDVRYNVVVVNPNNSFNVVVNEKGEVLMNEKNPDSPQTPKPAQSEGAE